MKDTVLYRFLSVYVGIVCLLGAALCTPHYSFAASCKGTTGKVSCCSDIPGQGCVKKPLNVVGASSGTLAAAALETAGYRAQSIVVRDLHQMLRGIGGLIFIGSAISGIITVALLGSYKVGSWLFVGPALFYFLIGSTVTSSGAEWQVGATGFEGRPVSKALGGEYDSEVSWVFHRYNEVVSSIVQNLIHIMSQDDFKHNLKFMTRQRMMDSLLRADIERPGLQALTWFTFAKCGEQIEAARAMYLGSRDKLYATSEEFDDYTASQGVNPQTPEYELLVSNHKAKFKWRNISLPDGAVKDYLRDTLDVNQLPRYLYTNESEDGIGADDDAYRHYNKRCESETRKLGSKSGSYHIEDLLTRPVSCELLSCWMGFGVHNEFLDIHAKISKDLPVTASEEFIKEMWEDIATKLGVPEEYKVREVTDNEGNKKKHATPELGEYGAISAIPVVIGGFLIRKTLLADEMSGSLTQFSDRTGINVRSFVHHDKMSEEETYRAGEKLLQHQFGEAERYEVYQLAMALPYLQGVLLYVLGLTFPFFALMVLVPGQAGAFFSWMALWAWIKSWDVGWAAVMVIDDVLWNLMPHSSVYDHLNDPTHGPITVFETAFQGDPSYSTGVYYAIVGTLVTGVPMITAQFIIGGKKAMAGVMMEGLQSMGQRIGGRAQDWVALEQAHAIDYRRESGIHNYVMDNVSRPANEEAASYKDTIESESGSSSFWNSALAVAGGALMAVGATALIVGLTVGTLGVGTAVLAVAAVGAGATASYNGITNARDSQRSKNTAMADYNRKNAKMHAYHAGQLRSFRNNETLRGMVTLRGEYWNHPDVPTTAMQMIDQSQASLDARHSELRGNALGEGGSMIVKTATRELG